MAKAFYGEGGDVLVLFEDGAVVEDVAIGSRVIVARVIVEESVVQNRECRVDVFIVEKGRPGVEGLSGWN